MGDGLVLPSPKNVFKVLFMREYIVKSKLYVVPPKKNIIPVIIINACAIIFSIVSLFDLIMDGVKLSSISSIIIALIIAVGFKKWYIVKPYYQFSSAHLTFDQSLLEIRYDNGKTVIINLETVESLEYSDKLECIRFICNYSICEASSNLSFEKNEYLLYLSATEHPNIIMDLERSSKHQIVYVDRI